MPGTGSQLSVAVALARVGWIAGLVAFDGHAHRDSQGWRSRVHYRDDLIQRHRVAAGICCRPGADDRAGPVAAGQAACVVGITDSRGRVTVVRGRRRGPVFDGSVDSSHSMVISAGMANVGAVLSSTVITWVQESL